MNGTSNQSGDLHTVHIHVNKVSRDALVAGLETLGIDMVEWEDAEDDAVLFDEYFSDSSQAERRLAQLRPHLEQWLADEWYTMQIGFIVGRDWREAWKENFHTERVSDRIVIKPAWEQYDVVPGDCVIEIDSGMSFGTGQHATTRACLRFIDSLSRELPGVSFLDIGCGSGVLAIAAARLGLTDITAIDVDAVATRTASENFARNGVRTGIKCMTMDLVDFEPAETFDIVVANMMADLLARFVNQVVRALTVGSCSRLILAGILTSQYEQVRRLYEDAGLSEIESVTDNEWTAMCLKNVR